MVIRERFVHQLETLREDLLRLGNMVEQAISRSMKSLDTWNTVLANQIIQEDTHIDATQHEVEEKVIMLIATQQPVASDLRLLGSVFAIASELERIGDYACSIARRLRRMTNRQFMVTPPPALSEMAGLSQKMLSMSLESFLRQDVDLAHSLSPYDDQVDELEERISAELINLAHHDPVRIEAVIDLLDIVHALERVADRATNIGERVIYLTTSHMEELNP